MIITFTMSRNKFYLGWGWSSIRLMPRHRRLGNDFKTRIFRFQGLTQQSELITSPGQITVNFNFEIENLIGSNFSDVLTGNELNNSLIGGKGDNKIDGDSGIDIAVYAANFNEVTLTNFVDYGSSGENIQ